MIIKLFIIPFILTAFSAVGQDSIKVTTNVSVLIGNNVSLNIKAIRRSDNLYYYLLIKNSNKLDSILFSKSQTIWKTDTCIIVQKKFCNKGRNEIIIQQIQANQVESESPSSYTTVQIWDTYTKTNLFYGASKWYSDIQVLSNEHLDNNYQPTVISCICEGAYDIEFAVNGDLIIKNLVERSVNQTYCNSDHEEGTYSILNGKYILNQVNKGK